MKKIITLMLAVILLFSVTACGAAGDSNDSGMKEVDALTVLETVWGTYAEDEKFAVAGGDMANSVMDAPGTFDIKDTESLDSMLGVPADIAVEIENAASLMHMMNANTFTAGSFVLADGADMDAFSASLKDNIMNRQWMCGFPDTLIIVSLSDNHVVSAFGNAEIIETFKTKITASYESAEVIYEESLV